MESIDTQPWYSKYVGIPWKVFETDPKIGIDCFNLIKLIYKNELNIDIPYETGTFLPSKDPKWYYTNSKSPFDFCDDPKYGWEQTDYLQPYCMIILHIGSANCNNHCALYLGHNKILHIMEQDTSRVSTYGKYYHQYTANIYKWKELKL